MKSLYLECNSGISGDMTVAALLDLGADKECLLHALESLPLEGYQVEISRVSKSGIDACDFRVILDNAHENHDHDMEYLHGHSHSQGHFHDHEEAHQASCEAVHSCEKKHKGNEDYHQEELHGNAYGHSHVPECHHSHEHTHAHTEPHSHPHVHRGIKEIREIIEAGDLTQGACSLALRIFSILAQAEGKAHGRSPEEVHFHEVGAVDSIVDIVAAAVCLDNLGIKNVIIPYLCEGRGTIRCQHGILPIPVPAVANIAQEHQLPLRILNLEGELVTPTGAAFAAAVRTSSVLPEQFCVSCIGIGAGKRRYECPGIVRAMLIEHKEEQTDIVYKLETNIDDCTGETMGYVLEKLMLSGARDVHYIPCFMKKNRPAWILTVICTEDAVNKLEQIIFQETTTIGIRKIKLERSVLKRQALTVATSLGEARVKVCTGDTGKWYYPEYESIAALSRESGLSYSQVYEVVRRQCEEDVL